MRPHGVQYPRVPQVSDRGIWEICFLTAIAREPQERRLMSVSPNRSPYFSAYVANVKVVPRALFLVLLPLGRSSNGGKLLARCSLHL